MFPFLPNTLIVADSHITCHSAPLAPSLQTAFTRSAGLALHTPFITSLHPFLNQHLPTTTIDRTIIIQMAAAGPTTNSFRTALFLIKELIFGILAVGGCLITQCLIIAWLAVSKAQINFVLLQARMLRRIYGQQPVDKKVECRSTGTQTEGENGLDLGLFYFADEFSKAPIVSLPPTSKTRSADLPVGTSKQAKATRSDWQTQSLMERKPTGKRPYAIRQVDSPARKKPIVPAVRLTSKAAEFKSLLDIREPSPVPQETEVTSAKARHSANPAAQEQPTHGDGFSNMDSSSGRSSSSWKATPGEEHNDSIWAPIKPTQSEPQRSKFKFTKSSGVKLIKHDGPTNTTPLTMENHPEEDIHHGSKDADVAEYVPGAMEVSKPLQEETLPGSPPPNDLSTPAKRYESDQMRKLRESPTDKPPEHLSATKHLMDIAKSPGAVPNPFIDKSEAWDGPKGWDSTEAWHLPNSSDYLNGLEDIEASSRRSDTPNSIGTMQHAKTWPSGGSLDDTEWHRREDSRNGESWSSMHKPPDDCYNMKDQKATMRPISEQMARESVVEAFREREECRIKLNNAYSLPNASDFKEKAKAYNKKRFELIAQMPLRELDEEDAINFPYLSAMDTGPPPVCRDVQLLSLREM